MVAAAVPIEGVGVRVTDPEDFDLATGELGNAVFADDRVWWINSRPATSFQDGAAALHEALVFYAFGTGAISVFIDDTPLRSRCGTNPTSQAPTAPS